MDDDPKLGAMFMFVFSCAVIVAIVSGILATIAHYFA